VQAHTLGEVGILSTVLLRVSSGTILPIFIEIGSYLTDRAKNKLARIFETRCILYYIIHRVSKKTVPTYFLLSQKFTYDL